MIPMICKVGSYTLLGNEFSGFICTTRYASWLSDEDKKKYHIISYHTLVEEYVPSS